MGVLAPSAFLVLAPPLYLAIAEEPVGYARTQTAFGFVSVDPTDSALAEAEGQAVQEAAKEVLLLVQVNFAIVEEGSTRVEWAEIKDGLVTYPWIFPHGLRRLQPRPAVSVLRHEIGHDLFARHLVRPDEGGGYGTMAPDWLDEMVAIAFETYDQRLSRAQSVDSDDLVPLTTLLRMQHPELLSPAIVETGRAFTTRSPSSDQTIPFYSTISALYDYLIERTGRRSIVAEAARVFTRGGDLEQWLPSRLGYAADTGGLKDLDEDFRRWFCETKPGG